MSGGAAPSRWHVLIPLLIVLLGVALRVDRLGAKSLWIDEVITYEVAQRPLLAPLTHDGSVVGFCLHDLGPGPLAYASEWAVMHVRPSETLLRWPSAVFGSLTLAAMWLLLCVTVSDERARWLGLAVWATMASQINFAQDARGYALATLLVVLSLWSAMRTWRGDGWRWWWLAVVLQSAGFFVSVFSSLFFGALALATLVGAPPSARGSSPGQDWRTRLVRVATGSGAYLAVSLPWLQQWLAHSFSATHSQSATAASRLWPTAEGWRSFASMWSQWTGDVVDLRPVTWLPAQGMPLAVAGAGLLAILAALGLASTLRRRPLGVLAAASLTAPFALITVFASSHFVTSRYLFWLQPLAVLCTALGAETLVRRLSPRWGRAAVLSLIALVLTAAAPRLAVRRVTEKANWRGAVAWLREQAQPGDIVLTGPNADFACVAHELRGQPGWASADLRSPGQPPLADMVRAADAQSPPLLIVLDGTDTAESVVDACAQGRRVWYITPFWRSPTRMPEYWDALESRFSAIRAFPGEMTVGVWLFEPTKSES